MNVALDEHPIKFVRPDMADSSKTFLKRVISALLAAAAIIWIDFYGGPKALNLMCTIALVLGVREFARMAFKPWSSPLSLSMVFWVVGLSSYVAMFIRPEQALHSFVGSLILFLCLSLWTTRGKISNENLLAALSTGVFGLVYCVLFPYYATRLALLEQGEQWFLFLLLVVFWGDTFAYFGGRWFGRHKFMPMISPNKTWQGSIAGMIGSAIAGYVHLAIVFPGVDILKVVFFCLACGFAAQCGDLLMSLVKRVAQVKDSGTIMPGHGGVLDRLDGIYIACPLVYAFTQWLA